MQIWLACARDHASALNVLKLLGFILKKQNWKPWNLKQLNGQAFVAIFASAIWARLSIQLVPNAFYWFAIAQSHGPIPVDGAIVAMEAFTLRPWQVIRMGDIALRWDARTTRNSPFPSDTATESILATAV